MGWETACCLLFDEIVADLACFVDAGTIFASGNGSGNGLCKEKSRPCYYVPPLGQKLARGLRIHSLLQISAAALCLVTTSDCKTKMKMSDGALGRVRSRQEYDALNSRCSSRAPFVRRNQNRTF